MDFEGLGLVVDWDHHLPPPAAKTVVENLPRTVIRGSRSGENTVSVLWGRAARPLPPQSLSNQTVHWPFSFPGQVGASVL